MWKHKISIQKEKGALLVITLIMLLIISMLGMSTMGSSSLEMQMANNSRAQQAAFEAAEYTLSWVENNIQETSFTNANLMNQACGAICFEPTCSGGYCFNGSNASNQATCALNGGAADPYLTEAVWTDSDRHMTLAVPNTNITARYIIEFRCYTALDPTLEKGPTNFTRVFRITVFATAEGGRARSMLRSTLKEI